MLYDAVLHYFDVVSHIKSTLSKGWPNHTLVQKFKFVPFCSSSFYHHHISVPLCGNVWGLWPWLDHVPICFVVGAEWKEIAKLQRRGRGKHQLTEDSVFNVDVRWRFKVPICAWKYEYFSFDQKFWFHFMEISSGKWNSILWNSENEDNLVTYMHTQSFLNFWPGISIPCDLPPGFFWSIDSHIENNFMRIIYL